jgi:hypothetical protein
LDGRYDLHVIVFDAGSATVEKPQPVAADGKSRRRCAQNVAVEGDHMSHWSPFGRVELDLKRSGASNPREYQRASVRHQQSRDVRLR